MWQQHGLNHSMSTRAKSLRNGKADMLAYHIRQAFKTDKITPELAGKLGYEFAMRYTKGRHAFIVAVHEDKAHVRCHIVFNSTRLDYLGKFKNPMRSNTYFRPDLR